MDVSTGQLRAKTDPAHRQSAQARNGRTKCMVKAQPRNETAQAFRDLQSHMNHSVCTQGLLVLVPLVMPLQPAELS